MIWMEKKSEQVWRKSPLDMNFTDGAAVTLSSQDKRDHHPLREVDGDTLRFRCALIQLLNRRMSRVSCCCCCCCSFFSIFCFFCFLFFVSTTTIKLFITVQSLPIFNSFFHWNAFFSLLIFQQTKHKTQTTKHKTKTNRS